MAVLSYLLLRAVISRCASEFFKPSRWPPTHAWIRTATSADARATTRRRGACSYEAFNATMHPSNLDLEIFSCWPTRNLEHGASFDTSCSAPNNFDRSTFINKGTTLGRGGVCGLKAYEVVRFAIVSSVRGRQCPVGEGRRNSAGWVGDARGDKTCGREGCRIGCEQDRGQ